MIRQTSFIEHFVLEHDLIAATAASALDFIDNSGGHRANVSPASVVTPAQSTQASTDVAAFVRKQVRTVSNWPAPGVEFRDITPLFSSPEALHLIVQTLVERYKGMQIDAFAGLEARGFILAPLLAYELKAAFIPIRKKGKLPFETVSESYKLEYGEATVEVHTDACQPGARVVLVDDLIATGGTMMAGRQLLVRLGATVVEGAALIDLPDLGGSQRLTQAGLPLFTLCAFAGH